MKIASEVRHEYEETQKVLAESRQKRRQEFLQGLPPSEDPQVTGLRRGVSEGHYSFSGMACDHCQTELVHGNEILASYPPLRRHYCPGCGASVTLPAYLKSRK